MKILTAFCFSGTGNTRYLTEYLCKKLSGSFSCAIMEVTKSGAAERIEKSDLLLFAFPIYGSEPPRPMRRFVHANGPLLRGKQVIVLETQYFFSGDGAASLGRTLEKYGATVIGAETFNMPNNLADCKAFPIKNGEEIERTLARARKRADRFAERLLRGKAKRRGFSLLSRGIGYFSQRKFWRKNEAEKHRRLKVDPARCVGCGACVKQCPVENLSLQGGKAVPHGDCALCYRCVNLCPKQAITLIGSAPPEHQYKGPKT